MLGTVSDVISYFERIVAEGTTEGVFRDVCRASTALDIMMVAHMMALHTREVREVTDLDGYIKFHLEIDLRRAARFAAGPQARGEWKEDRGSRRGKERAGSCGGDVRRCASP